MTGSKAAALLASAALALAAAGCGGDDGGSGGSGGSGGAGGGGGAQAGTPADTFEKTCGGCHTLKAAGARGQVGPNLDQLKPDKARVLSAIKRGPSVMPSGLLTGAKADAVATYVADNAGK